MERYMIQGSNGWQYRTNNRQEAERMGQNMAQKDRQEVCLFEFPGYDKLKTWLPAKN
jgi:hypothetical protein